jgi:hypothetical protein
VHPYIPTTILVKGILEMAFSNEDTANKLTAESDIRRALAYIAHRNNSGRWPIDAWESAHLAFALAAGCNGRYSQSCSLVERAYARDQERGLASLGYVQRIHGHHDVSALRLALEALEVRPTVPTIAGDAPFDAMAAEVLGLHPPHDPQTVVAAGALAFALTFTAGNFLDAAKGFWFDPTYDPRELASIVSSSTASVVVQMAETVIYVPPQPSASPHTSLGVSSVSSGWLRST